VEVFDHVPYRFDGKQLFAKYLNEVVAGLASASFGFRQPSCRVYGDTVGIVWSLDIWRGFPALLKLRGNGFQAGPNIWC
jgi:hypothetical protein